MQKRNHVSWYKLDNIAKIFPSTINKRDTKVFRFACELKEEVDRGTLQEALEQTLDDFPVYRSVLKRGLFWYYLETSTIKPIVQLETKPPCSPLYHQNKKSLLFEVSYFHNRINLEVFHSLSDGTGALQFLKSLVRYYLIKSHPEVFMNTPVLNDYDASLTQKKDDSFLKYYSENKPNFKIKSGPAYRIRLPRLSESRISVIEGKIPLNNMIQKARDYHVTLTVLVAALFMCAIEKEMAIKDKKYPVKLVVPVNLRKYFYSETVRNFFGLIDISYDFGKADNSLENVMQQIAKTMNEELTIESLTEKMNGSAALEHNIFARSVPLFLKDIVLHEVDRISEKERTAALSNVGKIDLPLELKPYVDSFDVIASTNVMQICMCSYENNLTITFTSAYNGTDIQKNFFRSLTQMGIPVQITSNNINES
ncbi:hypothetical protein RBG61_07880 [Paludicola sp. MB14-C6]|uniref:hypothetical protein n=1 Tax=Paludihabitans sp. MB14-C6 TaxID=3070656 RepID=UPI0027DD4715|nr:hypothetical protein [Paludicola sp. MB14-C6]WMJ21919.1 hypothetical protein RBG61_07880 [Paludicola sp. MB14-C6]